MGYLLFGLILALLASGVLVGVVVGIRTVLVLKPRPSGFWILLVLGLGIFCGSWVYSVIRRFWMYMNCSSC